MFLERSKGLYPERLAATDGNEMGSIQRSDSTCMDGDAKYDLFSLCGSSRDFHLESGQVIDSAGQNWR
jgi:hypothetical protein